MTIIQRQTWFFAFYCLLFLSSGAIISCKKAEKSSLPVIKAAPQFFAESADNKPFQSKNLQGSVWVVYFFFSSCSGPCPILNQRVADVQKDLPTENLHFVGISVDPETDTPAILNTFGKRYNRNPSRWSMVRVSEDSLASVAATGFMLGSPEDPALHSTRLVVVDKQGQIRGFYDGMDDAEIKKMKTAITELLRE
jgi:protein SCO1/2